MEQNFPQRALVSAKLTLWVCQIMGLIRWCSGVVWSWPVGVLVLVVSHCLWLCAGLPGRSYKVILACYYLCWTWRHVREAMLWIVCGWRQHWAWSKSAKGRGCLAVCPCLLVTRRVQLLKEPWAACELDGMGSQGISRVEQVELTKLKQIRIVHVAGEAQHRKYGTHLPTAWEEGSTEGQWRLSL